MNTAVYYVQVDYSPELSDETLAERVQRGETDAFGALVERYEEKLNRYGRKFLADRETVVDLVQDTFLRTYENIQSFDGGARFSPWIYRIAHNVFVNELKKKSRNPLLLVDFDTLVSHPAYDDPAPREREQREMREMIERGLAQLPPKYREVLVLYYLQEVPYKEIADILQVPLGTVGVRLKRAKEALAALPEVRQLRHD